MEPIHTIADLVQWMEKHHCNPRAFNYHKNNEWKHISTESFIFDVKRLTYGLISLGLKRGDKVGILATPSPQWNMVDFAIMLAGGISVPLFDRMADESFIYEVALANISILFVEGDEQMKMYEKHRNLFEQVIRVDNKEGSFDIKSFYEVKKSGENLWQQEPHLFDELTCQIKPDDVATIIFTAGATGVPKGAELTHQNLCHLISFETFKWKSYDDLYLSVLPLAHVFARQINLIMIGWGISVYYLNDLSKLAKASKELKPSLMIVVPRLLEKMYDAIEGKVRSDKNKWRKKFTLWAFNLAKEGSPNIFKRFILRPICKALVYDKILNSLGGRWRVIISGGAALDSRLHYFYLNVGIPIYEGWGLTEASTTCVNRIGKIKVGTVGPPLPGVKIKLAERDEILLGGPTVMKGYYRNPTATEKAIDKEGWLHTGDKGQIDKQGNLKIVGRVKEQFKLSSGEYLAPDRMERLLTQHPLVDMALALGERRKYAACLLFADKPAVKRMKDEYKLTDLSDEQFLTHEVVKKEIEALIESVNKRVNRWEQIRKWRFAPGELTIEEGDLTPTLKIRRDTVLTKYDDLIEEIYSEEFK